MSDLEQQAKEVREEILAHRSKHRKRPDGTQMGDCWGTTRELQPVIGQKIRSLNEAGKRRARKKSKLSAGTQARIERTMKVVGPLPVKNESAFMDALVSWALQCEKAEKIWAASEAGADPNSKTPNLDAAKVTLKKAAGKKKP